MLRVPSALSWYKVLTLHCTQYIRIVCKPGMLYLTKLGVSGNIVSSTKFNQFFLYTTFHTLTLGFGKSCIGVLVSKYNFGFVKALEDFRLNYQWLDIYFFCFWRNSWNWCCQLANVASPFSNCGRQFLAENWHIQPLSYRVFRWESISRRKVVVMGHVSYPKSHIPGCRCTTPGDSYNEPGARQW